MIRIMTDNVPKVYLLQQGKKIHKKKTSVKKGEESPIFNEAIIFNVPTHTLQVWIILNYQTLLCVYHGECRIPTGSFHLIPEHTDKTNCSGSKQWSGRKFEAILRWAYNRRTHVGRKSVRSLETNVGCSKASCRHVASAQKMKGTWTNVERNVGTKIYMDFKYIWRMAALHRHNVIANHPGTPPGFELFTFLKNGTSFEINKINCIKDHLSSYKIIPERVY